MLNGRRQRLFAFLFVMAAIVFPSTLATAQQGGPGASDFGRGLVQSQVREFDFGNTGTVDRTDTFTYTWNRKGQLTKRVQDSDRDNDGTVDRVFTRTFEYDKKGNLSARVFTFDFDSQNPGTNVRTDTATRTYDKPGDLVRHFQERDLDNDGTVDSTITFIFTYNNDRTRATLVFETDTDADGTRNNVWNYVYTHSKEGDLRFTRLFGEFDADDDGGPADAIDDANWTFNARGDTLRFTNLFDFDNDGNLDFVTVVNSFSANGVRFLREQTTDDNADGSVDDTSVTRYYYDQHGNLVLFVEERDFDLNTSPSTLLITTTRVY